MLQGMLFSGSNEHDEKELPSTMLNQQTKAPKPPLAPPSRVILLINLATIPYWIWFQIFVMKAPFPPIGPTNVVGATFAILFLLTRIRWAPAAAAFWGFVFLLSEVGMVPFHLADLSDLNNLLSVITFGLMMLTVPAGIVATIQNYRQSSGQEQAA